MEHRRNPVAKRIPDTVSGAPPNVLLTGRPGIGKTTVIRRFLRLTRVQAGGFFTQEMIRKGKRFGFSLNLLNGETRVLASTDIAGRWRVGKYGVDVEGFESAAVPEIEAAIAAGRMVVIDEIGKMEMFSRRFCEAVQQALDAPVPVLGTLLVRPHPFADAIRARRGVDVLEVTAANRDRLPAELGDRFGLAKHGNESGPAA